MNLLASMKQARHRIMTSSLYSMCCHRQPVLEAQRCIHISNSNPYNGQYLVHLPLYSGPKQVHYSNMNCQIGSQLYRNINAYMKIKNIDIDRTPGWSWKYGYNVAPQEIVDDGNTYRVATSY